MAGLGVGNRDLELGIWNLLLGIRNLELGNRNLVLSNKNWKFFRNYQNSQPRTRNPKPGTRNPGTSSLYGHVNDVPEVIPSQLPIRISMLIKVRHGRYFLEYRRVKNRQKSFFSHGSDWHSKDICSVITHLESECWI